MMQVPYENCQYFPHLFLRPAEMTALEQLPAFFKDRIYPTIFLRPWVNSLSLEKSVVRIHKAFPERVYFIELDRFEEQKSTPASVEFRRLWDPYAGYKSLRDFAEQYEKMSLTVNGYELRKSDFAEVERWATKYNRRIVLSFWLTDGVDIEKIHEATSIENPLFSVSINAGWSTDILSQELKIANLIQGLKNRGLQSENKILLVASSFPEKFDKFSDYKETNNYKKVTPINESLLFKRVKARFNDVNLVYGDWGSAREPKKKTGGVTTIRIDYCNGMYWYSRRSFQDRARSYRTLAEETSSDIEFQNLPESWGKYTINAITSIEAPETYSVSKNTACRINMHLVAQIQQASETPEPPKTEEYPDD